MYKSLFLPHIVARRVSLATRRLPTDALRRHWFYAKRAVGISTRSDRPFLAIELARLLENGNIRQGLHVMAAGRSDGLGAQALSKLSPMAFAKSHGLTYVHTPFQTLAHPEGMSSGEWAALWEQTLNLGLEHVQDVDCNLPLVGIEQFVGNSHWWTRPCVVVASHYTRFTDRYPQSFLMVAEKLQAQYHSNSPSSAQSSFNVRAHLRRGDVSAKDRATAHRAPNVMKFANTLSHVRAVVRELGINARFEIHSQGDRRELQSLEASGWELHLDSPARETFHKLATANVLVMGRSSFSFVAALMNRGVCIYDAFVHPPLPGWLRADAEGALDQQLLTSQLIQELERYRKTAKPYILADKACDIA